MGLSEAQVQQVWEKGGVVTGTDPKKLRKDACGAWIERGAYGSDTRDYGWVADLVLAKAEGGKEEVANLRPMQWRNALSRKEGECAVVARGTRNVLAKPPVWPRG